jgi:DNA-binding response OmpR family regulator
MKRALRHQLPDLVILDIGLPDSDGFEVARALRAGNPGMGIVMLTGRSGRTDLVRGLTEGADAYLSKPVDIDVLVATLQSVARRLNPSSTQRSPESKWRLSSNEWLLISPSGSHVTLSKAERRLLERLMEQPNEVILRETLMRTMTGDLDELDPHRLDSLIHRLRRKVLTVLGEPLPLSVVHGTGYVLAI